ncbi:MAG TPA: ATP-binding protein, partial [Gordonia sp. (in: high G+C Gram-positive bacteria)]|nr:ATP-binding protein [Gordonia sp. (in: high G+C Gram-positive bacteria)]
GLGLAIVTEIVRAHGGTVSVADNPGDGAAFTITLPLAPQTPDDDGRAEPESPEPEFPAPKFPDTEAVADTTRVPE